MFEEGVTSVFSFELATEVDSIDVAKEEDACEKCRVVETVVNGSAVVDVLGGGRHITFKFPLLAP